MLIKTPKGDYVFYKETDSIVIKKKNIENTQGYDEGLMNSKITIVFIMLVRGGRNTVIVRYGWEYSINPGFYP